MERERERDLFQSTEVDIFYGSQDDKGKVWNGTQTDAWEDGNFALNSLTWRIIPTLLV